MDKYSREYFSSIKSKEDFLKSIDVLLKDYEEHYNEWENGIVDEYLESIKYWILDVDNTEFLVDGKPSWSYLALLFYIGKIYE